MSIYSRWLAFGEKLNKYVTILLFAIIYFLLLPLLLFFREKDRLNLKSGTVFWSRRSQLCNTLEHMRHMS